MTGPFYGCDQNDCSQEQTWPAEDLRVHEDEVWCEYCWDARDTIWLDGDNGDSGGDYLMYSDLEKFVPPEQQRISELEAIIEAAPHHDLCNVELLGPSDTCDCWKSKIGEKR